MNAVGVPLRAINVDNIDNHPSTFIEIVLLKDMKMKRNVLIGTGKLI